MSAKRPEGYPDYFNPIGYAYLTDDGSLHVDDSEEDANNQKGQGVVVKTNLPYEGGKFVDKDGEEIHMAGIGLFNKYNNQRTAEPVKGLNDLYNACKG